MEFLILLIGIVLISLIIFIVTHLHPLTKSEEKALGRKRRKKQIRYYFSFENREYSVDK